MSKCRGPQGRDVAAKVATQCARWFPHGDIDVDDLAQEGRLRVWQNAERYDAERGSREAFEATVARSAIRRLQRDTYGGRRSARRRWCSLEQAPERRDPGGSPELRIDLERVLLRLSDEQRALCQMKAEGVGRREMARRLGMSRSTLYRRMEALLALLAEMGFDDWLEDER